MIALGANQYIKKPYELKDIGKTVKEALFFMKTPSE